MVFGHGLKSCKPGCCDQLVSFDILKIPLAI